MPEATKRPWKRIETDTFGIYAAKGIRIAEVMTRPAGKGFGFADEAIANTELIVKAVNSHDALVAALEAVEWAVPTPEADNAGKPVKFWVVPTVFERKNHMKVCQLADALEQVK